MYKLVVFAAIMAYASAGLISPIASPWGNGAWGTGAWGNGLLGAPAVVGAPLVGAPIIKQAIPAATSYANSVRIASPSVAVAAPARLAYAAPAPVISTLGHGW